MAENSNQVLGRPQTRGGLIKVALVITAEQDVMLDREGRRRGISRSAVARELIASGMRLQVVAEASVDAVIAAAR